MRRKSGWLVGIWRIGALVGGSMVLVLMVSGCPPLDETEPTTPPAPEHDPVPSPREVGGE
jgi:hypothetical protein